VLIRINGHDQDIPPDTTVAQLLERLDAHPKKVAVEVNRDLVTRNEFGDTVLRDGDNVEVVTFVGGG
jgi:sulfur carrier protein